MLRLLEDEEVPWDGIYVVQVDERVASLGDPERNLTSLRESLLLHASLRPAQIHPMPVEANDLAIAAAQYAGTLEELTGWVEGMLESVERMALHIRSQQVPTPAPVVTRSQRAGVSTYNRVPADAPALLAPRVFPRSLRSLGAAGTRALGVTKCSTEECEVPVSLIDKNISRD